MKLSKNIQPLSAETIRNSFLLLFAAIFLASCTSAIMESESPKIITPNPTNPLVSHTITATTTVAPSPFSANSGWRTFNSAELQVEVDYPSDWSVAEQADGVFFISQSGSSIQMAKVETGEMPTEEFLTENRLPNTRCSTSKNGYDIAVRVCIDTISRSYSADFVVTTSKGIAQLMSLSMVRKGDLQVFEGMVGSVRQSTHPFHLSHLARYILMIEHNLKD